MNDSLSAPLQLQLITLLCFSPTAASLIRSAVEARLFSSGVHRRIVESIYAYIDEYHRPPQQHIADLISEIVEDSNVKAQAELYVEVQESIDTLRTSVDEPFVLSRLEAFVRQQSLRTAIVQASDAVQAGDLDAAENALRVAFNTQLSVFSPGIRLTKALARIEEEPRIDLLKLGIKPLDDAALGPARGELWMFMAPPKCGKSWSLVHIGKQALLRKLNVLHITLEISERLIMQRYVQSLFSVQRSEANIFVTNLHKDTLGRVVSFEKEQLRKVLSFKTPGVHRLLKPKLERFHAKERLLVKAFPTGQLTIRALDNYLDLLERTGEFNPDVLVLDYPELMKVGAENFRLEIGAIVRDFRGILVARNMIGAAATQSNRLGSTAKLVTGAHIAEDYSKVGTVDTLITYSQTAAEKQLGLARLYAANTRVGDDDRFAALITQAYRIGQFALDASPLPHMYESKLEAFTGVAPTEDKEAT